MAEEKKDRFGTNQGEGNRDAARRYNEAAHEHAQHDDDVARQAKDAERALKGGKSKELKRAELIGKRHAKEEDPEIRRDYTRGR